MLPKVILHNSVSADGRITGFMPDMGLHYGLLSNWNFDIHLAGSETILAGEAEMPDEPSVFEEPVIDPDAKASILVVPDSRGRIKKWHGLRTSGFWKDVLVLVSESTPKEYLDYLDERFVKHIVAGKERVDMRAALEELNASHGAETVLLDSGGTLNAVMLSSGLVDEVSLLVHSALVGGSIPKTIFDPAEETPLSLELINVEKLQDNYVWLRYKIIK